MTRLPRTAPWPPRLRSPSPPASPAAATTSPPPRTRAATRPRPPRPTRAETPTDDPDPSETSSHRAGMVTVPIYFVGDTPQGARLFREFRQVEADNPLEEAAALMVAGDALDPDYGTPLPQRALRQRRVHEGAGAFVAEVAHDDWAEAPGDMTAAGASSPCSSSSTRSRASSRSACRCSSSTAPTPATLFGIDTDRRSQAAPQLDVLALINVTTPEEGQTVSGTFTAEGVASSFEATVPWEIRDESGDRVLDGLRHRRRLDRQALPLGDRGRRLRPRRRAPTPSWR